MADKVHLMLLSTDTTKAPQERVARQTTKHGLYNALDIGSIWLQKQTLSKIEPSQALMRQLPRGGASYPAV